MCLDYKGKIILKLNVSMTVLLVLHTGKYTKHHWTAGRDRCLITNVQCYSKKC